jgi:hypothetical protein
MLGPRAAFGYVVFGETGTILLWTDWQRVPMLHAQPIGFLYWRERFWAGDQWVYSLITAQVDPELSPSRPSSGGSITALL